MCKERKRTRDLLLEYDYAILPPRPRAAGLHMVYPWEQVDLTMLAHQLYKLAVQNGYTGSEALFLQKFAGGSVITGTINTFPIPGDENNLYLDTETDTLYYYKHTIEKIYTDLAARIGVAIVGTSILEDHETVDTYLYIPVRAMPIENLIYDCGSAAEYID